MTTKLALNTDQVYALALAVDMALDDFYHAEDNGNAIAESGAKRQLEGLQAILGEKIAALQ